MSNEAYLRSLERQIDARRQRQELEAAKELALDRSIIRRNQGEPFSQFSDRGGGGAPLRDTNGDVLVGVRGLLAKELRGEGQVSVRSNCRVRIVGKGYRCLVHTLAPTVTI